MLHKPLMQCAFQNPQSLIERSTAKRAGIVLFIFCLVSLSHVTLAGETAYSADALMAAFKKGSHTSLKGTEITFTGVVAEIKKSKVIFKSSDNDKVICELVSYAGNGNEEHLVGSALTVVGKVRGRGILGNVTLDQCHLALLDVVSKEPPTAEPSPRQSEEPAEQADDHSLQTNEVEGTLPVVADMGSANGIPSVGRERAITPVAHIAPTETFSPPVPNPSDETSGVSEQLIGTTNEGPTSTHPASGGRSLAVVALLVGIGAVLALAKLRPAIAAGLRTPNNPTPERMRRAAFEALLSEKKKKWG
jgi:hypothetical protein